MKAKYGNYLEDLRDRVKKFNDYEIERRIHILATLLYCTPETQNFCCRMELLDAAECQIHYWRSSFGHNSFL